MIKHRNNKGDVIDNLDLSQQKRIRIAFGYRYSQKMLNHFRELEVVNAEGCEYSRSYIRQVFNNLVEDRELTLHMLSALLREEQAKKLDFQTFKQKKEALLN